MQAESRVLAVIPARSGSKGIPGKNLVRIKDKPLIAYMIESALRSQRITKIIVSTDSREIADVARSCGAEIPFIRPIQLAADHVPLAPVTIHAMKQMDSVGFCADVVVTLQPTSPLTQAADIDEAIEKLSKTGCDSVVSMKKVEECHPWRVYRLDEDRVLPFNEYTNESNKQRQDWPPVYKFSGAIFARQRRVLENSNGQDFALGRDVRGVLIPAERAVDINSPLDLLLLKAILDHEN
jgi:CMP-N,N'-diacetyllegionaminic acid synthase